MNRVEATKAFYNAFASGDRGFAEGILADNFMFSSPPDPLLDKAGYFEKCWPHSGGQQAFDFKRIIESGDEIVVTYELEQPDGTKGRNTEILTYDGDKVSRAEVYFGWTIK